MTYDRLVPFGAVRPSRDEVGDALRRFLGRAASVSYVEADARWRAVVLGPTAVAWPRPLGHPEATDHSALHRGRVLTVALTGGHLVVSTKQADDVTDALACGFARASAYAFGTADQAKREEWW